MAGNSANMFSNSVDELLRRQLGRETGSGSTNAQFDTPFAVLPFQNPDGAANASGTFYSGNTASSLPGGVEIDDPHPRYDDDLTLPGPGGASSPAKLAELNDAPGTAGPGPMVDVVYEGPTGGGDTIGNTNGSSGALAVGGSVNGVTDYSGDEDRYAITVTAGQTVRFTMAGATVNGAAASSDTTLTLFDASGTQLAFNDDSIGLHAQITHTFATGGTYYIQAASFGSVTGGYSLSATDQVALPVFTIPEIADQLLTGYWGGPSSARRWAVGNTDITFNVQGLSAPRAAIARLAFATWADVTGLTFSEITTGGAEITLDDTAAGAYSSSTTQAGTPRTIISSSINVATSWSGGTSDVDDYTFQTFIHEIGHSLGLGHGGNYNGSAVYGVDNHYQNDTWQTTIMSYFDQSNYGGASARFALTPQMADIYALQQYYGAGTARSGDSTYGFNVSGLGGSPTDPTSTAYIYNFANFTQAPAITIYDSGGTDTLDVSGYTQNQLISLVGGTWSNIGGLFGNVGIYLTSVIENAVGGSGNDTINGNSVANVLNGNAGNDVISGGDGNDTITGGLGNDTLTGDANADTFIYLLNSNADIITDFIAAQGDRIDLSAITTITSLAQLLAIGQQSGPNTIFTFAAGHTLTLNNVTMANLTSGNFIFSGPGTITGTTGNDVLLSIGPGDAFDGLAGTDRVSYQNAGAGVIASLADPASNTGDAAGDSYTSIEGLEGSEYDDTLTGDAGNNVLLGRGGYDSLIGSGGNDTLDAGTAPGRATWQYLSGGAGDDTYLIQQAGRDHFITSSAEGAGGGADTINFTDINFRDIAVTYPAAGEGAALQLNWSNGSARVALGGQHIETYNFADGITLNTFVAGTAANETVNGGALNDHVDGGDGNDTVNGNDGNDWLQGGAGYDNLFGGAGNDTLDGGSAPGRANFQYLHGGAGNDTYRISKAGRDYYITSAGEGAGQGTDKVVFTDINYSEVRVTYVNFVEGPAVQLDWTGGSLRVALSGQNIESFEFADGTIINSFAQNAVNGTGADDVLLATSNFDAFDGGAGNDRASYQNATSAVTASLASQSVNTGFANGDTYVSIEGLEGSAFDDMLYGDAGNNVLLGGNGFDTLYGGAGNDTLDAGATPNRSKWQYMLGGTGDDTYNFSQSSHDVYIYSGAETSIGGTDRAVFTDINFADVSVGFLGTNNFWLELGWGGTGPSGGLVRVADSGQFIESFEFADGVIINSFADGTTGADTLNGNAGNNFIRGLSGSDVIDGNGGADWLTGGGGNDTFTFDTADFATGVNDRILDFHEVAGDTDILRLQGTAGNYTFANSGGNLVVTHTATGGSITIGNFTVAQLDAGQVQYF